MCVRMGGDRKWGITGLVEIVRTAVVDAVALLAHHLHCDPECRDIAAFPHVDVSSV